MFGFIHLDDAERVIDFALIVVSGVFSLSAAAWLISRCLPRHPAARHLVLSSALGCCLLVPFLASAFIAMGWSLLSLPLLTTSPQTVASQSNRKPVGSVIGDWWERWSLGATPIDEETGRRASESKTTGHDVLNSIAKTKGSGVDKSRSIENSRPASPLDYRSIAAMAIFAWALVSVFLLVRLGRSCWGVSKFRRSSSLPSDDPLRLMLEEVCRGLDLRRPPLVVTSQTATAPFAAGFGRAVIVLPKQMIGVVSRDEMRDILVHEVAHILRCDHAMIFFQELTRALYWPIVPIHALARELTRTREELCDNYVLGGRDAISYSETLLHLAQMSFEARPLRASVGILQWKGELERRVAGLLDERRNRMTKSSRSVAFLVTLLFVSASAAISATRFVIAEGIAATAEKELAADAPKPVADRSMLLHVNGPDGRPMSGAKIHRSVWTKVPVKDRQFDGKTDENGQIRLPVPDGLEIFRVWAQADGYVPLFAHWERDDAPDTSLPTEFTVQLDRGTVIGGLVRDIDGKPIRGVAIEVKLVQRGGVEPRVSPNTWLSLKKSNSSSSDGGASLVTDAEGKWTLYNVPPGENVKVLLNLDHPDYVSDATWGSLQNEQGIDMPALRAKTAMITMRDGVKVQGRVIDPDGKPVNGAVVVRGDQPYWEWGSQEVRTDERGVYLLPALPRGEKRITVIAEGWKPETKIVNLAPDMPPVDFRVTPGKELRVRFLDRSGKPIPGVSVQVGRWRNSEALYNYVHPNVLETKIPTKADDEGRYRWTWAPDDAVTYRFWKEGFSTKEVELTPSSEEQTVTFP